jgi:hypothetical protein
MIVAPRPSATGRDELARMSNRLLRFFGLPSSRTHVVGNEDAGLSKVTICVRLSKVVGEVLVRADDLRHVSTISPDRAAAQGRRSVCGVRVGGTPPSPVGARVRLIAQTAEHRSILAVRPGRALPSAQCGVAHLLPASARVLRDVARMARSRRCM